MSYERFLCLWYLLFADPVCVASLVMVVVVVCCRWLLVVLLLDAGGPSIEQVMLS